MAGTRAGGARRLAAPFWEMEAALNGRTVSERLASHYRRLASAHVMYRRMSDRGAPPPGAVRLHEDPRVPFDDRGVIFIRHGQPQRVVRTQPADIEFPQNETWAYSGADGLERYTFLRVEKYPDYHLSDRIFSCGRRGLRGPGGWAWQFNLDRGHLGYPFNSMVTRCMANRTTARTELMSMRADGRAESRRGLRTRRDLPRFRTPLPLAVQLYTFRGEDARGGETPFGDETTQVLAGLLVPAGVLEAKPYRGELLYSAAVSFILVDTTRGMVERRDTVVHALSDVGLGSDRYLRVELGLEVPPTDSAQFRVLVRDAHAPTTGTMLGGSTQVRAYGDEVPAVSDLVLSDDLGTEESGQSMPPLLASHTFEPEQPIHLYFEIYGLEPTAPYRIDLRIQPLEDENLWDRITGLFGSDRALELSFEQSAPSGREAAIPQLKRITTGLSPGRYRLDLRLTTRSGDTVTRTTRFTLRE